MLLSSETFDQLRTHGWTAIRKALADESDGSLVAMARELGQPCASRVSDVLVDRLSPTPESKAHPKSLSQIYGTGSFPFHTDTAHWAVPARYILLGCKNPGESGRRTLLFNIDRLFPGIAERRLLSSGVFLVRNGRLSFYSSILFPGRAFVRLDWGCMTPATSDGHRAKALVAEAAAAADPIGYTWQQGDVIIIDNWRVLHGREAASGDNDRLLLRVTVMSGDGPK